MADGDRAGSSDSSNSVGVCAGPPQVGGRPPSRDHGRNRTNGPSVLMSGARAAVDDAALVREVATGSQDALAELYDRHASAVFAAACRLTTDRQLAEEVVQETFLAVWNRAELFNPATGSLAAWLHTIARNRTVDRLRASARRPR